MIEHIGMTPELSQRLAAKKATWLRDQQTEERTETVSVYVCARCQNRSGKSTFRIRSGQAVTVSVTLKDEVVFGQKVKVCADRAWCESTGVTLTAARTARERLETKTKEGNK